jgi:hypothetical protein
MANFADRVINMLDGVIASETINTTDTEQP